ncbi:hypothetical protein FE257_001275 [Aspergillus nanangensis]|uniref:Uncharacterized protein n=1 Tax=Aspergillus nanangensis TaxID=2582783 RepID=A0AAD4GPV0_ASPNN|nr:hypothetical protein FE257_001275 [Aspergillus nanangensis]
MTSATSTRIVATATSTACTGPKQYELPTHDAVCGIPNTNTYRSIFDKCAEPAGVRPYHNDCALYAPAVDQSVQDLIDCLYKAGIDWEDVWCTGETNATATATSYPKPTTGDAVTSKEESSATSSSASAATGANENGAARGYRGAVGVKMSLALVCLVVSAFVV